MIEHREIGRIAIDDGYVALIRWDESKPHLKYDDDARLLCYKFVYFDGTKESELSGIESMNNLLSDNDIDIMKLPHEELCGLAQILSEYYEIGKYVDIQSALYQGVAAEDGVKLSEFPTVVRDKKIEFVIFRSTLDSTNSGFFHVHIPVSNFEDFSLSKLG